MRSIYRFNKKANQMIFHILSLIDLNIHIKKIFEAIRITILKKWFINGCLI
jgi:hypothetical protein